MARSDDGARGRGVHDGEGMTKLNDIPWKMRITCALCLSFFCMGAGSAILGPTLLNLQESVGTTLPVISQVFTARSVGILVGVGLGGPLFDRFRPLRTIAASLLMFAVGITSFPFFTSLVALLIASSIIGLMIGLIDSHCNLMCIRLWGSDRSPVFLQILHFSVALGCLVSPLVIGPFLAPENATYISECSTMSITTEETTSVTSPVVTNQDNRTLMKRESARWTETRAMWQREIPAVSEEHLELFDGKMGASENSYRGKRHGGLNATPTATVVSEVDGVHSPSVEIATTSRTKNDGHVESEIPSSTFQRSNCTSLEDKEARALTNYRFELGFVIIGSFAIVPCIVVLVLAVTIPKDLKNAGELTQDKYNEVQNSTYHHRFIGLMFMFNFLYVGAEVAHGGYLATFAIESDLQFGMERASKVVAVFWGTFAAGRFLAIVASNFISPRQMVLADTVGTVSASLMLSCFAEKNELVLWIGSALLGLSMASFFPSGFGWLQSLTVVTGKSASVLFVGSALGQIIAPFIIGFLMDSTASYLGPNILMYYTLTVFGLASLVVICMFWLSSRMVKYSPSARPVQDPAAQPFQSFKNAIT